MRFMSPTNRHLTGFTLVEVLIIAPIVILAISAFIALMIAIVGDVLVTRDQNNMTYEAQDALDRVEQDVRLSVQFLTTTGTLVSPQGSDNNFAGTAAFTSGTNYLILSSVATDESPVSPTRYLLYYANQPYACGTQQTLNKVFLIKVAYFIKAGSLWRRTIVPDYNINSPADSNTLCTTATYLPWQQNSCSPGYAPATRCQTNDAKIMDNIDSLTIRYYGSPGSTTDLGAANATSATTIEAVINGKKTTAGRELTASASLRATKINNISAQ